MTPCEAEQDGPIAPCTNVSNSSYVENSGYEAELSFLDTACSVFPARTNGLQDRLNNCFYYNGAMSITDLPAAYQDTVFGDSPSVFNIGFGSAAAEEIVPGRMYDLTQFFNSTGDHNAQGRIAAHSGSITTEDHTNVICLPVGFGDDAYCHFGVDFASVGGPPSTPNILLQVYPLP